MSQVKVYRMLRNMSAGLTFALLTLIFNVNYAEPKHMTYSHDWDMLIFTQSWPPTVCKVWKHNNPSHECIMPADKDAWSIHGIWPTKIGTRGPSFCNRTWLFDPEQVRPIEKELIEHWTNVEVGTSEYALWAHEWTKHGTCAAAIEPLRGELKYFEQGLHWLGNYTMTEILKEANILPSNTQLYEVEDLRAAVKNKLGVNPDVECRKIDGQDYVIEIRVCFTKNLVLNDCDAITGHSCDHTEQVLYPHYGVNKVMVELYRFVTWLQWLTL